MKALVLALLFTSLACSSADPVQTGQTVLPLDDRALALIDNWDASLAGWDAVCIYEDEKNGLVSDLARSMRLALVKNRVPINSKATVMLRAILCVGAVNPLSKEIGVCVRLELQTLVHRVDDHWCWAVVWRSPTSPIAVSESTWNSSGSEMMTLQAAALAEGLADAWHKVGNRRE
jgi:hypothetical protein